jgi:homopolymeric O-antigen transport system ATP-binding protein
VKHDSVIDVMGLGKSFRSYPGAVSRLMAALLPNLRDRGTDHWVLRGVDLTVERGETVGIIGRNGSGKSTLLKLLTGALHPTEGDIRVEGRVLALLELGTGMNPDLSGRQNVLFSAQLHALDEDKITSRMGEIEAFAELGEYFDAPVRTYSSGMFVRLAFSSFIFMEPRVLIIDEALGVGDLFFQQKCFDAIMKMKAKGTTILFVSHDMGAVTRLCDRAIVLDAGRVAFEGSPDKAVTQFYLLHGSSPDAVKAAADRPRSADVLASSSSTDMQALLAHSILENHPGIGRGGLEIVAARCLDQQGADTLEFGIGETMRLLMAIRATATVGEPNVGFYLHDRFNQVVFGINARNLGERMAALEPGETFLARFDVTLSLAPGEYALSLAVADHSGHSDPNAGTILNGHERIGPLCVRCRTALMPFYGIAGMRTSCEIVQVTSS